MRTIEEIKKILLDNRQHLIDEYHISEIGIFGSYVRGEQTPKSDLDILVTFTDYEKVVGLIGYSQFERYLSDLLGVKIDLVENDCLKPYIGKHILSEAVYL